MTFRTISILYRISDFENFNSGELSDETLDEIDSWMESNGLVWMAQGSYNNPQYPQYNSHIAYSAGTMDDHLSIGQVAANEVAYSFNHLDFHPLFAIVEEDYWEDEI